MSDLVNFENTYIQTEEDITKEEGDAIGIVTIDGFPEDETEEGSVVCEVILTVHRDIVISWHLNAYRGNPEVMELIEDSKKILQEM